MEPTRYHSTPSGADPDSEAALRWALGQGKADEIRRNVNRRRLRVRRLKLACGVGALAMIVAGTVLFTANIQSREASAVAQAQSPRSSVVWSFDRQTLADGTLLELRKGAQARVLFTNKERRIELVEGALFVDVAKDALRPFVVVSGSVQSRALGTAFTVEKHGENVSVLVTSGRVEVTQQATTDSAAPHSTTVLEAGTHIATEASHAPLQPTVLASNRMIEQQAWRVPKLEFSMAPLSEVIPLFSQHSGVRITLADSSLSELKLSGVLRANNTEALGRLLELQFGIKSVTSASGEITLRR